jgi:hypothetical protein
MTVKEKRDIHRKLRILSHAKETGIFLKRIDILEYPEKFFISGKGTMKLMANSH